MDIILRKVGGKLVPLFRSKSGASFGIGAPAGSIQRFLVSPVVMLVLGLALLVAWALAHPLHLAHAAPMLLPFMGTVSIRELRAKRSNLATELRALTDGAEKENRNLTTEEDVRYGKLFGEVDELRTRIEREERTAELERSLAETKPAPAAPDPAVPLGAPQARNGARATQEYRDAYASYLCNGQRGLKDAEVRALAVGNDAAGGFTVAPEQFVDELIKGVDNALWIRTLARRFSVPTAATLGTMTLDADPADADWTSELAVGNEDTAMAFGKRKLTPHPLAKYIKVSNDFLRMTLTGGETLVRDRLAYKFGVAQEKGFMVGTGAQQALGVFTASSDGIDTSRDVSSGNSTTSVTFDGLLATKYSLKQQYWTDALRWVFHRDAVQQIAKLKDGEGQYLWRESVRVGEPDRILNFGIAMSEYAPNTFTTGLYVGLLGNFQYYWIADAYDVAIRRLDELFALTNQVGFVGRCAVDGQPVLAEAFARVKLT